MPATDSPDGDKIPDSGLRLDSGSDWLGHLSAAEHGRQLISL